MTVLSPERHVPALRIPAGRGPRTAIVPSTLRRLRPHAPFLLTFLFALLVCGWLVTWGDGSLFQGERLGGFYDAQMRSMLHGHFDVAPAAIEFEAFIRDGKSYGYYGVTPSLLRLPLLLLFPSMDGRWTRPLMLVACALNLIYARRALWHFRDQTPTTNASSDATNEVLFVLSAGVGSTLVFMVSRAYVYHEAILWGATFALMSAVHLLAYLDHRKVASLALAGLFAGLSFHARATAGAGAILAVSVTSAALLIRAFRGSSEFLLVSRDAERSACPASQDTLRSASRLTTARNFQAHVQPQPTRERTSLKTRVNATGLLALNHAALAATFVAVTVAAYFAVNCAKFRTFDGVPVRLYGLYIRDPQRMAVTGGRQIHPGNLPTGVATYFGPHGVAFSRSFPWVYMSRAPRIIGEPTIDVVEPHSAVLTSMPALALLAFLGCRAAAAGRDRATRDLRFPLLALFAGGGLVLMTVGITERYLHDLYPFLVLAGAAGAARYAIGNKSARWKLSALMPLVAAGMWINCAFAIEFQREIVWGVPQAKREAFVRARQAVDRFLHVAPTPAPAAAAGK